MELDCRSFCRFPVSTRTPRFIARLAVDSFPHLGHELGYLRQEYSGFRHLKSGNIGFRHDIEYRTHSRPNWTDFDMRLNVKKPTSFQEQSIPEASKLAGFAALVNTLSIE